MVVARDDRDHPHVLGFLGQIAVLIGIIIGSLIAWPMGLLTSTTVGRQLVRRHRAVPLRPAEVPAAAIISMCIVVLVTYTESTADMLAVAEMVDRT